LKRDPEPIGKIFASDPVLSIRRNVMQHRRPRRWQLESAH
jgi:hypothetical protein